MNCGIAKEWNIAQPLKRMKVLYLKVYENISEVFIKQRTMDVSYALMCVKRECVYVHRYISLKRYVRLHYVICLWEGELVHWGQGGSETYFSLCILLPLLHFVSCVCIIYSK